MISGGQDLHFKLWLNGKPTEEDAHGSAIVIKISNMGCPIENFTFWGLGPQIVHVFFFWSANGTLVVPII